MIISFLNQGGGGGVDPSILSAYGKTIAYDTNTHYIQLKNGDNVLSQFDASQFIIDGMVDNVYISGTNLVIDFNTDSGKQDIEIPLSDIFDPSNYYTKTDVDAIASGKVDTSALSAYTLQSDFVTHSGNTNIHTTLAEKAVWDGKQDALRFYTEDSDGLAQITVGTSPAIGYVEVYDNLVHFGTENTEVHIQNTGVTINNDPVVTDSQLNDYYTSAQTESAITQAVSSYQPITGMTAYTQEANFVAHSGNTIMHTTAQEKVLWNSVSGKADSSAVTQSLSSKQDTLVSGTNIKTINSQSLLGSGNIVISGGGSGNYYEKVSGLTIEFNEDNQAPQITIETDDEETSDHYAATMNNGSFDSFMSTSEDATYSSNLGTGTIGNMATDHPESGISSSRELQITTDGFIQTTENMDDNEGYSPYRSESEFNYGTGLEMHNTWTEPDQENVGEFIESSSRVTINSQQYPYIELEDVEGNFIRIDTEGINGSPIVTEDYVDASVSGKVDTSAITTAVTSASTDAEIPTALAVYTAIGQGGGGVTVDPSLNTGSTNPVANSAITNGFNEYTLKADSEDGIKRYFYVSSPANPYGNQAIWNFSINGRCPLTRQTGGANSTIDKFYLVETSAITSAITSASTNAEVAGAKAVYDQLGGLKLVSLTQSEYDQLATKDSATIYFIKNNSN